MTNIAYVGTQFMNGEPTDTSSCITGFDQVGFIMGTSGSAFNVGPSQVWCLGRLISFIGNSRCIHWTICGVRPRKRRCIWNAVLIPAAFVARSNSVTDGSELAERGSLLPVVPQC